ncbi:Alg9-like mannosyltransferase family-domain-containing protein [Choanephora cucurbitarum]|nr:Alg9-like mannosyltransferase family-domain-containing protein [Choanephora cucurbitarum]
MPRYFQATIAAIADIATYNLAKRVIGNDIALPMLFTTLCSWFNFHMAARTLSNSTEMALTMIALNFWPLPNVPSSASQTKHYRIALFLAALACVMRPTNGIIWLFAGCQLLWVSQNRLAVALNAVLICSVVVACNVWIDTALYKELVFTPLEFFKTNVINNISLFYGVHTWHWYLSQGLPVILTTFLPYTLFGLYRVYHTPTVYQRMKSLLSLMGWVISVYSLLPHKEFRFLFPIVPLILMVSAYGIQHKGRLTIAFLVLTQLPMALYLSLWHQRGVVDVMLWLRLQEPTSVGVLMPCHSTPWYSIIHKNIPMWFLTCEPPLTEGVLDEADAFYAEPLEFLKADQINRQWPVSHLVLFDNLLPQLGKHLESEGYKECQRFFNSHFHDDSRRRGDVVVLCYKKD